MESAGLRGRSARNLRPRKTVVSADDGVDDGDGPVPDVFDRSSAVGREPPRFTVDLSVAPEKRYLHLVPQFLPEFGDGGAELEGLFNTLVSDVVGPAPAAARFVRVFARLLLRRVHSAEETAELRGIAAATNLPMYLLVAFNVLLDLLLGCTSGGVRAVEEEEGEEGKDRRRRRRQDHDDDDNDERASPSRMIHFRTLDWGMDPLRRLVVELDFVRHAGGPVVGRAVTYFGYVGVLTGVREGLSMSLNFRPYHDAGTWGKWLGFHWHQLLVLTGWRPSISSVLRSYLLPAVGKQDVTTAWLKGWNWSTKRTKEDCGTLTAAEDHPDIHRVIAELSRSPSTSAYLVFCTPQAAHLVEKDNRAAAVRRSDTFLTAYNHDFADADDETALAEAARDLAKHEPGTGMSLIVESSVDRKRRVDTIVRGAVARRRRKARRRKGAGSTGDGGDAVGMGDVLTIIEDSCISNDETHYAAVMDPQRGKILWRRVYMVGELDGL